MQLNRETVYEVKDGESLRKALLEAEVAEKKCYHYANLAHDGQVKSMFETAARDVGRSAEKLKKMSARYM